MTYEPSRQVGVSFPAAMLAEIRDEAARLDRSVSWVVQRAWRMARNEIRSIPKEGDR